MCPIYSRRRSRFAAAGDRCALRYSPAIGALRGRKSGSGPSADSFGARSSWKLDADGERWVPATLKRMTLDDKVGQMLVSSFGSGLHSARTRAGTTRWSRRVHDYHVGGFHVFGGAEPAPDVLLNANYGSVTLGQPLAAASILNRLQAIAPYPLLNSADFETGAGFRLKGATAFPRNMAFGAAGDEQLAYEAGRITATESRAIGVQVNFAPVVDVNNNPRNPVINTRSFGEDPALVAKLRQRLRPRAAGRRDDRHAEALSRATATPTSTRTWACRSSRIRASGSTATEFPPFKAGIAAGAGAVMTGHIEMPALDPSPNTPTTLSQPIVSGVLRRELGFKGLIYTDSMGMAGVTQMYTPGEAAVRAFKAGNDVVLHSPDDGAAFAGLKAAVESGEMPRGAGSTRRSSASCARRRSPACTGTRAVSLDALPQHRRRPRARGGRRRGQRAVDDAGQGSSATRCR